MSDYGDILKDAVEAAVREMLKEHPEHEDRLSGHVHASVEACLHGGQVFGMEISFVQVHDDVPDLEEGQVLH